jgi:hypothetical protein
MARKIALVALLLLTGCQATQQNRVSEAKAVQAIAEIVRAVPDLPPSCVAKTGRAYPKLSEPWVVTHQRWLNIADIRDRQSADCAATWKTYQSNLN